MATSAALSKMMPAAALGAKPAFRALVDENAADGGYFGDTGFLCLAAGVSIGF